MAKGISTCEVYGGYEDIPALMAEYNPDELSTPMLARFFEVEQLERALRFVDELIKWSQVATFWKSLETTRKSLEAAKDSLKTAGKFWERISTERSVTI